MLSPLLTKSPLEMTTLMMSRAFEVLDKKVCFDDVIFNFDVTLKFQAFTYPPDPTVKF